MKNKMFGNRCQPRATGLAVGQPVEIKRGLLGGLSGVLVRLGGHGNCLVESDGTPTGILLSIGSYSLRHHAANSAVNLPPVAEGTGEWPRY